MRRERPRACQHLRRRRPPPGIPRPVRLGRRTEHPRTPLATDPTRSGTHAACGAPRRHTMPSAQAAVKRGVALGRTSVSQSLGRPVTLFAAHSPRDAERGHNRRISRKMARPAGFEPATPGLEGRSGEKTRNNTEQSGTENWFVCRVALLPHCVQDRVRDASGHGKRWIVPSPHAPRRRRRTPAPMPATGATRGPVRGCWGRGGGCGRGGGFARRGPAVGLMAGARRPTRIAGSSAAHGPLRALLEPS